MKSQSTRRTDIPVCPICPILSIRRTDRNVCPPDTKSPTLRFSWRLTQFCIPHAADGVHYPVPAPFLFYLARQTRPMSQSSKDRPTPPLRAILLSTGQRPRVVAEAERLRPLIEQYAQVVGTDLTGEEDMSKIEADIAIVLGGDGSILRAAHQMGARQLPVISVNLGKLGFLADVLPGELPGVLRDFHAHKLHVIEHLMFECRVLRNGKQLHRQLGLNETTVRVGPPFSIMDVDFYVDSDLVTTYSGDGLIISTPVGSTAHSLSAGGPILRKNLQAFVIMPISPHTLTHRPVVDSADRVFEMVVAQTRGQSAAVVDGRLLCSLEIGDRVRVERAADQFKMLAAPGHSYYRTLREKLGWSGQIKLDGGAGA
jgi:NAD+ kinase